MRKSGLIFISVKLINGVNTSRSLLSLLSTELKCSFGISSVYKKFNDIIKSDLNANLEFVIKANFTESADSIHETIQKINQSCLKSGSHGGMKLIAFEDQVFMLKDFTIPDPTLYMDPMVLHCSAEVWGEYIHPVFSRTLEMMALEKQLTGPFEFYMQGNGIYES